jgi:hypothetical protein
MGIHGSDTLCNNIIGLYPFIEAKGKDGIKKCELEDFKGIKGKETKIAGNIPTCRH